MKHRLCRLAVVVLFSACDKSASREAHTAKSDSPSATALASSTGYIDSAMPIEEALRQFRRDLPEPKGLSGGTASKEKLVRAFVRALETRDTSALRRLALTSAEFAWFYYPSSRLSQPPYQLPPALMWFQLQGESNKGASLLLAERAGKPLGYVDHTCGEPRKEGRNRLYPYCAIRRVTTTGDTVTERLFGLIIERGGMYKFVGYANQL